MPLSPSSTSCSLIQADLTPRSVWVARSIPTLTASSKLESDVALISVTRATDPAMAVPPLLSTSMRSPYPFSGRTITPLPSVARTRTLGKPVGSLPISSGGRGAAAPGRPARRGPRPGGELLLRAARRPAAGPLRPARPALLRPRRRATAVGPLGAAGAALPAGGRRPRVPRPAARAGRADRERAAPDPLGRGRPVRGARDRRVDGVLPGQRGQPGRLRQPAPRRRSGPTRFRPRLAAGLE